MRGAECTCLNALRPAPLSSIFEVYIALLQVQTE
jgi:hypothetical protein